MDRFFGRQAELKTLNELLGKRVASLVVIRGRRRIGKSRLIQEFGKNLPCHIFSGIPPTKQMTREEQINRFCKQVAKAFNVPSFSVEDWDGAFWHLGKLCSSGRIVIALDEISWIGSKDHTFLGELKNAWDMYFSGNPELILILCGSVSSWIEKNILSSTGFLGRISLNLQLKELPLKDAAKFWGNQQKDVSSYEILSTMAITGGVPRYLEEVQPNFSADENIRRLCFKNGSLLHNEFDHIFSDLFSSRAPIYASLVQLLADKSHSLKELCELTGKSDSIILEYLKDLDQAGFISEDYTWNLKTMKTSRLRKYRLSDNYVRFYLKYIAPNKESIAEGAFQSTSLSLLPGWSGIMGLQFENLVLNNVHSLLDRIGLNLSDLIRCGPFFQRQTQRQRGCQIDLLIQSRLRAVFLCEVKFSKQPVGMKVVHQVQEKQNRLSLPRGWSIRPVLIHVNGATSDVIESDTFHHIIDFSELISCP